MKKIISFLIVYLGLNFKVNANPSMLDDYNKWMNSTSVGTTIDWANGKLTRTETGARFIDSLGMVTLLPKDNPNFDLIAKDNPNIAAKWKEQYGFTAKSNTQINNSIASTNQNHQEYMTALKEGSLDAFIEATKKYKSGSLSKDKYVEIALTAAATIEYEKNTKGSGSSVLTEDPNKWFEVNQNVLPKMREDYVKFLNSIKMGESVNWANGKLIREASGALYIGANGIAYTLPDSTNGAIHFNEVALRCPDIAALWKSQYGFEPVGKPVNPFAGYSNGAMTSNIQTSADGNWYPKPYGIKIMNWITLHYNSLQVGQTKNWNDLILIRAGSPNCLLILSKDGSKKTQLCMSDDYDRNLLNDPFGSEIARKYWGYGS